MTKNKKKVQSEKVNVNKVTDYELTKSHNFFEIQDFFANIKEVNVEHASLNVDEKLIADKYYAMFKKDKSLFNEVLMKKEHETNEAFELRKQKASDFHKTLTLDMQKLNKINVMKNTFRNVVFSLAKEKASHALLTCYVYKYYKSTNDRSREKRQDKEKNTFAYAFKRSTKQLQDLLKEEDALINMFNAKLQASEYYSKCK